jgi:hypothetical protein
VPDDPLKTTGASPSTISWLVRCWVEPREEGHGAEEPPVVRCFLRDLRTGQERYLNDPRALGELVLRQLRAAEPSEAERGETGALDLLAGG